MGMKFNVTSGLSQSDEIKRSTSTWRQSIGCPVRRVDTQIVWPRQIEKGISEVIGAYTIAIVTVGATMDAAASNSVIGQ